MSEKKAVELAEMAEWLEEGTPFGRLRAEAWGSIVEVGVWERNATQGVIVSMIAEQFEKKTPRTLVFSAVTVGSEQGELRTPDAVIVSQENWSSAPSTARFIPAKDAYAVVEILAPHRSDRDRDMIRWYSRMGVETLIQIDPLQGVTHLFSAPCREQDRDTYARCDSFEFSYGLPLGAWSLDSSKFPRYDV